MHNLNLQNKTQSLGKLPLHIYKIKFKSSLKLKKKTFMYNKENSDLIDAHIRLHSH